MEKAATARNAKFSETLLYRLDRFISETTKAAESRLREASGMSFSQFLVLAALLEHAEANQATIADYVGVTPAVITKQVEILAGRGLVHLGPSHHDRRANLVKLTSKGRQEALGAIAVVQEVFNELSTFPDHYRSKLSQWLRIQSL